LYDSHIDDEAAFSLMCKWSPLKECCHSYTVVSGS